MDLREESAALLESATKQRGMECALTLLTALHSRLSVLDEEILKLRKELRTRNGGEDV